MIIPRQPWVGITAPGSPERRVVSKPAASHREEDCPSGDLPWSLEALQLVVVLVPSRGGSESQASRGARTDGCRSFSYAGSIVVLLKLSRKMCREMPFLQVSERRSCSRIAFYSAECFCDRRQGHGKSVDDCEEIPLKEADCN